MNRWALLFSFSSTLASLAAPVAVHAQCMQPGGARIPTDPGCSGSMPTGLLPVFACACDTPGVCDIGAPCASGLPGPDCPDTGMNATCESRMWHAPNDNMCIPSHHAGLDPVANCMTTPETFSPTCALTFDVLSRGTALFRNVFGWYEVTGSTPGPDDLHVMLDCASGPGTSVVLDVRSDPTYHGGEIGFFLLTPEDHTAHGTCAGGDCCASIARFRTGVGYAYFSEHARNPDGTGFVHLLVYDSVIHDRKFYFAWEDTFAAPNNDFTDLVTSVDGVECAGAGADCDTGMPGACGRGITRCSGGTLSCVGVASPVDERCNGLDDDCDGTLDEAVTCPGTNVCDDGRCVPHCQPSDEFTCTTGFTCDAVSGLCREVACQGVTCGANQVCRGGTCVAECDGIVCPHGQECSRDQCVDLCAGVTCGTHEVCRGGLCVPGCDLCDGVVCGGGLMCTSAGNECSDPSCPTPCAAGTFCRAGVCVDDCDGAVCPRHATCVAGQCVVPMTMPGVDGGTMPRVDAAVVGRDAGDVAFDTGVGPGERRGCGCSAPGGVRGGWLGLVGLLGVALLSRRRRSRIVLAALALAALAASCTVQTAHCSLDTDCPTGTHCQAGSCQSECTNDVMCIATHGAGARCTSFGQCAVADSGTTRPDANLTRDDAGSTDANVVDAAMSLDVGTDAGGTDAGGDGGSDAGGSDAGRDAGGADAGHDAAMVDAATPLPGVLNETDLPAEADYCVIQFPITTSTSAGVASTMIFGQIFEAGRTEAAGAASGVRAQLGYGPTGTDPRTSTAWMFHDATFNLQVGNNDEYQATLTVGAAGSYAYAYRFSFDAGASYTYCDTNGAGSNPGLTFEPGSLGVLTVL